MLEVGSVLRTWSHFEMPSKEKVVRLESLADHRPAYLDYEGPVSDNRGTVSRVDEGMYEAVEETESLLQYRLNGKLLTGLLSLKRDENLPNSWTAAFSPE